MRTLRPAARVGAASHPPLLVLLCVVVWGASAVTLNLDPLPVPVGHVAAAAAGPYVLLTCHNWYDSHCVARLGASALTKMSSSLNSLTRIGRTVALVATPTS